MLCSFLLYDINQLYVHTVPSLTSLPRTSRIPPFSVITEHWTGFAVLGGSFSLAICCTHGSTYMSVKLFHFSPPSPSPHAQVSVSSSSTSVSLFLPCAKVHQNHFSRSHIYSLIYNIFFLFLT